MSTLAIDSDNDLYFDNSGRLVTISGAGTDEEILQRVKIKLRFFKNGWFLDTNHGIAYFDEIIGEKTIDINAVESIFRKAILEVEGISNILESSIDYSAADRELDFFFKATTINNTTIESTLTDI